MINSIFFTFAPKSFNENHYYASRSKLIREVSERENQSKIKTEHIEMLYNLLTSQDPIIRRLALIILLFGLSDADVFTAFIDIMCLCAVPGLVLINPHSLKGSRSHSFQKYWMQNRQSLAKSTESTVYFDAITNTMEPLLLHQVKNYLDIKLIGSTIDPLECPILVNFQPPNFKSQYRPWKGRMTILNEQKTQIKEFDVKSPENDTNETNHVTFYNPKPTAFISSLYQRCKLKR